MFSTPLPSSLAFFSLLPWGLLGASSGSLLNSLILVERVLIRLVKIHASVVTVGRVRMLQHMGFYFFLSLWSLFLQFSSNVAEMLMKGGTERATFHSFYL